MAEGRSRSTWSHTSTVLAMIANVNRDPKKSDPFRPSDFDPHAAKPKGEKPKLRMADVKGLLMGAKA